MWNLKYLIIGLASIFFVSAGNAQEWGPMNFVYWENPPMAFPGFFNPSYDDSDSTLYFDNYLRFCPEPITKIYISHLDSIIYDNWWWSDPIALPAPINIEGYFNAMPYISSNGDSLYFCSDRPGSRGGMDIWLSVKVNDEWIEPINLGDFINTELNENGPCYVPESQILFFDRNEGESWNDVSIYESEKINEIWQPAEILPEIINIPDIATYGAFYDEQENALYYTNIDRIGWRYDLLKSTLVNDEWQDPRPLSDNVNGLWYPNYCDGVTTENAFMGHDRNLLFYNKWIWEASMCIDFYSYIFVSEASVNVEEQRTNRDSSLDIIIYPNPSNSVFSFEFLKLKTPSVLKIYNIKGQIVDEFRLNVNDHYLLWDSTDRTKNKVSSGVYFAVLEHGKNKTARQFILLK